MKNPNFSNNQEPGKNLLRMQARASKRNRFSELGLQDGLSGKEAQYPEFTQYYVAWCNGHREYLLGQRPPVA